MELSKQVVSLELAKRLKELGVKQDSLWYWQNYFKEEEEDREMWNILSKNEIESKGYLFGKFYSAYTVAELGEMLPDWVDFTQKHYNSTSKKTWYRCYTKEGMMWVDEENEADARAKMLIYLIENKLAEEEDFAR